MLQLFCKQCNRKVEAIPLERPTADFIASCPLCGVRLSPHRLLAPGTIINGFRIEHEIGRGGMGIVYLAKQLDLDRDIALKVLSDEMASDEAFVKAFFREARGAAALNHPNIVQAIDAGTAGDIHYFVMELIDGENLEVYTAQKGALPPHLALKCATSIADALAYAWECKKLAHRDIKPENIIMKNNSEFKLADLGLVKDCREGSTEHDENLMATPAYAPPEVIRGEKDVPGFKSDMYSFGATLYQLFSGKAPFIHDDPMVICEMQQECQPKPLIGLNPELPLEISMLVDKLMEKDPNKRPGSWNAVLHKLNEITYVWHVTHDKDGNLIAAEEEESPAGSSKKQKILLGATALLAVLFVLELILFFLLPAPQKKADPPPPAEKVATVTGQKPAPPVQQPVTTPVAAVPVQKPAVPAVTPNVQTAVASTGKTPEPAPAKKVEEEETDPYEEWEDDPDELKKWQRNVKPLLPTSPYERWEMVQEYLEDNLYAPKEARKMLRDLEKKDKAKYIEKLKALHKKAFQSTSLKDSYKSINELDNALKEAPIWVADIFSLEDLKEITQKRDELKEQWDEAQEIKQQKAAERAEQQAARAEQKKKEQQALNAAALKKQQQQREASQAKRKAHAAFLDLQTIKGHAIYADDETFNELTDAFRKKHKALPDYQTRLKKLEQVEEFREWVRTPVFEIIWKNQKLFKGEVIFPDLLPKCSFRSADDEKLVFNEKKGVVSMLKRVPYSWGTENRKDVVRQLFYRNRKILPKLDEESILKLFAIAQCCNFPVLHYIETQTWLPEDTENKVKEQIKEIQQYLHLYKHYMLKKQKTQ